MRQRLLPIGLAFAGLLGLAACGDSTAQTTAGKTQPDQPVAAATVELAPDATAVRGTGMVAYKREVVLSFKITGIIQGFNVDMGDTVLAGQKLAILDAAEINAQWRETVASVEKAQRDIDRLAPLVGNGFATQARLDDARTALKLALAARDAIEFNRSLAEIRAPADGIVLSREVESGQIVPAGAAILTLGDTASGHVVRVGLADRDAVKISLGDPATVKVPGIERPLAAHVSRIAPKGDMRTGTFFIELAIDDSGRALPSGLIADALIHPASAINTSIVAIPTSAILEGFGPEGTVFVIDPATSTVTRRRVVFGSLSGGMVQVREGLSVGEQVVSVGAGYLREGDKVRVTDLIALRDEAPASATK
ncbi:efflux RND transporter periplasmic adaptor subunit [Oleomonas cavernae]|uniref:Efflux RND transporter periplasmic adaptor subunit n=1 Tax=Oleomonas cavernae TaxID=2320859 RepID=A0A418WFP0_9PROT|nr:efflux RND transporter periplasmic adaptor subunit [Oleomonas cavernae]RJF88802.1 efflux RND transporter periplasmic adaptor subunit [Oleomonas cavernae]